MLASVEYRNSALTIITKVFISTDRKELLVGENDGTLYEIESSVILWQIGKEI